MVKVVDERFMVPHPATVEWETQRLQCRRCVHVIEGGDGYVWLRCGVQETSGRGVHMYCIDGRLPGAKCGPTGRFYRRRE